jgi:two-component system, OmpR family, response regulator
MSSGYRILIYEPDAALGRVLSTGLEARAYQAIWSDSAVAATAMIENSQVDVAVVGLADDGLGLAVLASTFKTTDNIPVLLTSLPIDLDMRIRGLRSGAADYLIKPFGVDELLVRIATVLHRYERAPRRMVRCGDIVLDKETGRFGDGARWTVLTPTERQAFSLMLECRNRPVSKSRLKSVIGEGGVVSDNAVEVIIYRLRAKAFSLGMRIRTCRGLGYLLEYPT